MKIPLRYNSALFLEEVLLPLYQKLKSHDFVVVGNDSKTVELIDCHIQNLSPFDEYIDYPDALIANRDYIQRELEWYLEATKSVERVKDIKIWRSIANARGEVNSNYGYRIYHADNDFQYQKAVAALIACPTTRQSTCIYTYPQIQTDWNADGGHDMICTFSTQHFLRDDKFIYIVNMRSNDAILGFRNDFAWHCYVCKNMLGDLADAGIKIKDAEICWNAGSMHIYEARGGFDKLEQIVAEFAQ